ncbi:uncharacterized protein LOC131645971 [Vicia villosa]|uniref:uncharacterized protein LOC131645971 n=1 Tax=Vicia villosa TaxID=3911 RepID=UPI00273C0B35|nr:uncharacterized protein LOC131645971 [Vicia villosa]
MESTETQPIHKNKSKRHLFKCFKSDNVVDQSPRRKEKTSDPLLSYIALAEKQGRVLPTILSSILTAAKCGSGDGSPSRRRKMGKQKSLRIRQALIAALNHSSLGKKIINRTKANKNKNNWGKSRLTKIGEGDKITNTNHKQVQEGTNSCTNPSSDSLPAITSSTLSSSTNSTSSQGSHVSGSSSDLNRNPSMNGIVVRQEDGESRERSFGLNISLCWHFIISLLFFILLGKLYTLLSEKMK